MTDLRVIKTKKSIEEAFFKLRKKKSLEQIKIKDLCSLAMINKTTFYNYYDDIYQLSAELENQILEECFSNMPDYDCMLTDTQKFIVGIYKAFESNPKVLILFNNRYEILVTKAENKLLKLYKKIINTSEKEMYTLFYIRGAFYILFNYKCDEQQKLKMLADTAKIFVQEKAKEWLQK